MESLWAVVMRGKTKPLVVLSTSKMAEGCGMVPEELMPTPWANPIDIPTEYTKRTKRRMLFLPQKYRILFCADIMMKGFIN